MPEPEVFFWGCLGQPGHFMHSKTGTRIQSPWAGYIDTGVLKYRDIKDPDPKIAYAQLKGWTGIFFWDRSGDHRPGSNSAFIVNSLVSQEELLRLARKQWPEIFARKGFPIARVDVMVEQNVLSTVDAEIQSLRAAVKIAAAAFREYEQIHRAKGTPEGDRKAVVNAALAAKMEEALK